MLLLFSYGFFSALASQRLTNRRARNFFTLQGLRGPRNLDNKSSGQTRRGSRLSRVSCVYSRMGVAKLLVSGLTEEKFVGNFWKELKISKHCVSQQNQRVIIFLVRAHTRRSKRSVTEAATGFAFFSLDLQQ